MIIFTFDSPQLSATFALKRKSVDRGVPEKPDTSYLLSTVRTGYSYHIAAVSFCNLDSHLHHLTYKYTYLKCANGIHFSFNYELILPKSAVFDDDSVAFHRESAVLGNGRFFGLRNRERKDILEEHLFCALFTDRKVLQ